ncbi:cysteine hydrolase [Paracoccus aestuariivivens]|uniref:Isochorismatase family protein n=1 Tax=Paracoccus aestuariivivens TaxID=1820333 RepID=A0A6L6JAQ7_9RHOB|nr:cysteine hydrolase [Paracoccus aestuariivivens]MTH79273.1 isochorismatase family protein [Paracoccus aestuariivivens]
MSQSAFYDPTRTALLFVDPYNDFLAEGGKLWPLVQEVASGIGLHDKLRSALAAARTAGLHVFIVPHHQWQAGDFETWDHPTPYQLGAARHQVFAKGSWGAEWFPDFAPQVGEIVVKEHWGASGFANTDLDLLLKQCKVTHVVLIGLIANTCIEATGRFASELGYHVTLLRDATAAASHEAMHSAHEVNGPTFAHAILTTSDFIEALDAFGKGT